MDIRGRRILVIGGAGLIGSHVVEELLKEDIKEVIVYDNFCRGTNENLQKALRDPRCRIYEIGGDILQTDILNAAMEGVDGVIHLAALWLLQCHEYPRAAFDVNIRGTFNVLEACVANHIKRFSRHADRRADLSIRQGAVRRGFMGFPLFQGPAQW